MKKLRGGSEDGWASDRKCGMKRKKKGRARVVFMRLLPLLQGLSLYVKDLIWDVVGGVIHFFLAL